MFGSFPKTPYLCTRNSEFATPHSTFRSEKSAVLNNKNDAPVAQLVEHLTLNQGVQGSSPCGCTKERFSPLLLIRVSRVRAPAGVQKRGFHLSFLLYVISILSYFWTT